MGKNQLLVHAERIASRLVAEQTRARVALGFDAAILAAHEVFQMGPGRAAAFAQAYGEAMEELASLFIDDAEDSGKKIEYAKAKRDAAILAIVGPENFQPFDRTYGEAWMDELKRIRVMEGK